MMKIRPIYILLLFVLVAFMGFFRLGSVTLFDVDEAVFSEATKEMVQGGDWITPTYNGINRYDKPILFYWLMAASYKVFGVNEFGARFPSAFLGVILCMVVYFFIKYVRDEKNALYAFVALSLSIFFLVYSHAAVTDMTLTLFITLSLFSFYCSLRKDNFIYGFYAFSALAFLTKGLIGILFPFTIAFVYLMVREGLKGVKRMFNLKGVLLFCLISAPWYVAQTVINGQEFIRQFFLKHHFMRYTGVISGHKGPAYYYIPVLIGGLFPWISFFPAGVRRMVKEKDDLGLFALIWLGLIFFFFSFATTKLPNYILPAVPAACIVIASGMSDTNLLWRRYSNIGVAGISLAAAVALVTVLKKYLLKINIYDTEWTYIAAATMICAVALSSYAAFSKKTFYAPLSCLIVIFLLLLSVKALPIVNEHLQGTLYKYSLYAGRMIQDDDKIIAYGLNNPSIVFYSGHKVISTKNSSELSTYIESGKGRIAIAKARDIEALKKLNFSLLESDGIYAILERK